MVWCVRQKLDAYGVLQHPEAPILRQLPTTSSLVLVPLVDVLVPDSEPHTPVMSEQVLQGKLDHIHLPTPPYRAVQVHRSKRDITSVSPPSFRRRTEPVIRRHRPNGQTLSLVYPVEDEGKQRGQSIELRVVRHAPPFVYVEDLSHLAGHDLQLGLLGVCIVS